MAEGFYNFTGEVDFRNQTLLRMAGGVAAEGNIFPINSAAGGSEIGLNENGDGSGSELVMVTNGGFDRHLLFCTAGVDAIKAGVAYPLGGIGQVTSFKLSGLSYSFANVIYTKTASGNTVWESSDSRFILSKNAPYNQWHINDLDSGQDSVATIGGSGSEPFIDSNNNFTNAGGKIINIVTNNMPVKWKVWLTRFQSLIITKKHADRLFVRKSNFNHTDFQNYATATGANGTNVTMHPLNEYLGRDFVVDPIGVATGIAGYDNRTTLDNASLVLFSNHSVDQVVFVMICNPAGDIIKEVPVPRDSLMKIKKEPQETMFCLKASFEISGNGVKTAAAGTVESSAGSAVKIAYVG